MLRLSCLPAALAVLSSNFASHGMAQNPEGEFGRDLRTNAVDKNANEADSLFKQPLRSIALEHADADSVERTVSKLFPNVSIASETSTNTIFYRADKITADAIEEFAQRVEVRATAKKQMAVAAQAPVDAEPTETSPLHPYTFNLADDYDEDILLDVLKVLVEPKGGKFDWDAERRQLVGTYPKNMDGIVVQMISRLARPRTVESRTVQSVMSDREWDLREASLELEELRQTHGANHPKVRQKERQVESYLKWMADNRNTNSGLIPSSPIHPADSIQVESDSEEFQQHEATAASLAAEWREIQPAEDTPEFDAKIAKLLKRLKAAVNAAFAARQDLQKAEASSLREQLERIESRIERRADIRERIVARRVAELLKTTSEDAWDPAPGADQFRRRPTDVDVNDPEADADNFELDIDNRQKTSEPDPASVSQETDEVPAPFDPEFP